MFHLETYELIGRKRSESSAAKREVANAERRLGVSLPSSVREWYEDPAATQILHQYSNQDWARPLSKLTLREEDSMTLLVFQVENQGGWFRAVRMDTEEDDPPVYTNNETDGWQRVAKEFSTYLYALVWDYSQVFQRRFVVQLPSNFKWGDFRRSIDGEYWQHPSTDHMLGRHQFRYDNDHMAILIDIGDMNLSESWLATDSEADLANSLKMLRPFLYDSDPFVSYYSWDAKPVVEAYNAQLET